MSGGGSTTVNTPPAHIERAGTRSLEIAEELYDRPELSFGQELVNGQVVGDRRRRVADRSPLFDKSLSQLEDARGILDAAPDAGNRWRDAATGLLDETRTGLADGSFDQYRDDRYDTLFNRYQDPFLDEVVRRSVDQTQRSGQRALLADKDSARAAGAFGGSRAAIEEAVTNAETARAAGDISARLRSEGFNAAADRAAAGAERAVDRRVTGNLGLADRYSGIGNRAVDDQFRRGQGLLGVSDRTSRHGVLEQTHRQAEIDDDFSDWYFRNYGKREQDYDRFLRLANTSGGGTTTSKHKGGFLEGALGLAALGSALFAPAGGGGLFAEALSDERMKTDKKKIGKSALGPDIYSYRYKGDPKSYPKVVGPMAQDVEKAIPGSTRSIGGILSVRPEALEAVMESAQ